MRAATFKIAVLGALFAVSAADATIVLTSISPAHNQNFSGLASDVSESDIMPPGWSFVEMGAGSNSTYLVDHGVSTAGGAFSYGADLHPDRALGTFRGSSQSTLATIGARFKNDDTVDIVSVAIQYRGEQWKLGFIDPETPRADTLKFEYSLDAAGPDNGTWTHVSTLDFHSPNRLGPTGQSGSLDGNAAGNFANLSETISVTIPPSATFWIRWTDLEAIGPEDALAIDDFQLTATFTAVPEPGAVLLGGALCVVVALAAVGLKMFQRQRKFTFESSEAKWP